MKYYYDFHIHSCLSPCADDDMTPLNIAQMAKLAGLDIIAVTDHNSVLNARAVMDAAKKVDGPLVLAGIELETEESVHVVCLFRDIDSAESFGKYIKNNMLSIANRKDIYGSQLICNSDDKVVGEEEDLLLVSTSIGVYQAAELAEKYGGRAYPAHIDRESNGLMAILGGLDKAMGFENVEMTPRAGSPLIQSVKAQDYGIVYCSDAHRLEEIAGAAEINYLELESLSVDDVFKALNNIKKKEKLNG